MGVSKQQHKTRFKLEPVPVVGQPGTEILKCPPKTKTSTQSHCSKMEITKLPKGLIGEKCIAQVTISGQECNCLIDTGSQVTTIPLSFYEQCLSECPIHSLSDLLEVEGANGLSVPYIGYIELNVTFPAEFIGTSVEVPTLALVVPDPKPYAMPLVLIGTNTLDTLYEEHLKVSSTTFQPSLFGYRAVLNTLRLRHKYGTTGVLGHVRLRGRVPEVMAAGQTVILEGIVHVIGVPTDKWVVVEHPSISSLPGGVVVKNCLLTLPSKQSSHLPVFLTNETDHDITIPQRCVIAEIHALESVLSSGNAVSESASQCSEPTVSKEEKFILNFGDSPLSQEWKNRITKKLREMPEVFAQHDLDFGHTQKVKHCIKLHDDTPFKHRARPIHPHDIGAVRKHLQELLSSGVIRESESPFSSPIVVVRKKNGDVRLCIDYRKLNLQTVKDAYALPNLEETFSALNGSKWFTVLDLKSGYYQIEVAEVDKPKTAFVCPLGFWEFNRMPQGVTNAPSTFQRLMERCMGDINLKEVLVFLDDLIVFSKTLEEHERRLLQVLTRLKEYGLKLSPEKCRFFQTSVRYLGHIVSERGVETDPEKIEAIKTWPCPRNLKELRSFLGFSGYYRRFIKDYSQIVKPLNDLTSGYPPLRKGCKKAEKECQYYDPKEPFGGRWTTVCQEAFETLVDKLSTAPVLGFADPKLPYVVHTDASTTGLGAALYQEQDGQQRVIAFASRGLSRSESRYPAHKLEFLALKWAVTEKFQDYLYGSTFTVITDSNPLTYLLTTAKLDATSYRWLAALSTFSFKLQYRAGKQNIDADSLSRRPHEELAEDQLSSKEYERIQKFVQYHTMGADKSHTTDKEVFRAICEKHSVQRADNSGITLVESLALHPDAVPEYYEQEENLSGLPAIPHLMKEDLVEKQRSDPVIREVIMCLESGEKPPPALRKEYSDLPFYLREWDRLELVDGVLYRRRRDGDAVNHQLVLPEDLRSFAVSSLHDQMGHMGIERTLDLVRSRFYWPRMGAEVEQKVKTCSRCVRRKSLPQKSAPLVNIQATRPLQLVCMDFLSLEPDKSNTRDILVITDFFTKYAVAIPTPNQKARTVAKCLWDQFIVHYGFPERLHSDQGPDFESHTIKELCAIAGIQKIRTTPYHPRGNPVERFNRTLLNMLGTLEEKDKSHWKDFVKPLVHAYNCTKHEATGFSPYELMFGRQPRLPLDLAFGLPGKDSSPVSHSQYVQHLKSHLKESYEVASQNARKIAEKNKIRYDKHVTNSSLEVGDRVLVRNVRIRGKHKLADRWESEIYVVVKQAADLPVYTVRPETKDGPLRTLHRDLLLPCGFLPVPETSDPVVSKPTTRRRTRLNPDSQSPDGLDSALETDDEIPDPICSTYPVSETRFTTVHKVLRPNDPKEDSEESLNFEIIHSPSAEDAALREQSNDLPADVPEQALPTGAVGEHLPVEVPMEYLPDVPENLEASHLPDETSVNDQEKAEDECSEHNQISDVEENELSGDLPRRSVRRRKRPKILTYPQLGNPLIHVVQSLFQGLNTAFVNALGGSESLNGLPEISTIHDV